MRWFCVTQSVLRFYARYRYSSYFIIDISIHIMQYLISSRIFHVLYTGLLANFTLLCFWPLIRNIGKKAWNVYFVTKSFDFRIWEEKFLQLKTILVHDIFISKKNQHNLRKIRHYLNWLLVGCCHNPANTK